MENKMRMRYYFLFIWIVLLQSVTVYSQSSEKKETPLLWGACDHGFWIWGEHNKWGMDENGFWGHDETGAAYDLTSPVLKRIIEDFGFNLMIQEYARTPAATYRENIMALQQIHDFFASLNTRWIISTEAANHRSSYIDANNYDWYNRPDGRHFYLFPDTILQALSKLKNKPGILYDELAHMQNSRNISARPPGQDMGVVIARGGADAPCFFYEPDTISLEKASEGFAKEAKNIARLHKKYGLQLYSEHVFPIQYHNLAKVGFVPVTKVMKENCSPAYIACAIGAAIQYDKPFWVTPDLYMDVHPQRIYPGHSTDEYRSALLLAYHMGAEGIYTEQISEGTDGAMIRMNADKTDYVLTEHGEVAKWFRFSYVPEHPRYYSYKDLVPRTVIIRQEDSDWGQSDSWLPNWLFGIKEWHSTPQTNAWLGIWNLLSRGEINPNSISWHNKKVRDTPYHQFYPLDGVVVFDEKVKKEHLKSAELIFLTGLGISPQTLNAVQWCVKQGAVCVSLPHLVPEKVKNNSVNGRILPDGKGKWVITESFLDETVKQQIHPFLPEEEYIRYRFGDTEVQFRPVDGDYNKISVELKKFGK